MKFRLNGAALAVAASALLCAAPASAQQASYVVKDGAGATQHFCQYPISVGTIFIPCQVQYGLFGGAPTPFNETNSGALDVTVVGGTDSRPASGTITVIDTATTTATGQGGVGIVSGTPTANSFYDQAITNYSSGSISVSGTFVGTMAVEASYDPAGATYVPVSGLLRGTSTTVASITGPAVISLDVTGATHLRLRATAFTSGTATVKTTFSAAAGMTKILNGVKLVDSTGVDATDTTNHAAKVSIVAGGVTLFAPADASGTVTAGGTFQQVFASNGSRVNCFVLNPTSATEPLFVHWTTATATTSNSASLGPGSSFSCAGNGTVVTGAIQVTAATTSHAFIATGA